MKRMMTAAMFALLLLTAAGAQETPTGTEEKKESAAADKTDDKPAEKKANARPAEWKYPKEPYDDADVASMAEKCVLLETEKGDIRLEMFPESAPETVRNFLNLAATGAFDTTTFSRVVPGFVIQGGDLYTSQNLTNDLKWRAVKMIPDEPNQIRHEKGIVSMARGEEPNTAATSFFILLGTASYLDGKFAAFARVVEGYEVVETINEMPVENETPKEPVRLRKASVTPCPAAADESETSAPPAEPAEPSKEPARR